MRDPLLSLRGLEGGYAPGRPVLSGLSLDLWPGEVVGLLGRNGAGKTTLFRALAGLLPCCRAQQVLWRGRPCAFRDPAFQRARYFVFAENSSFPYFTFSEYLAYAAACYGQPVPEVARLVEGFQFQPYTQVLLKDLSLGSRKKAGLIAAFALAPSLLLLDEPASGLDFASTEFLYTLLQEYPQRGTVLFSSHILESLCRNAGRVVVLDQGSLRQTFSGGAVNPKTIREALGYAPPDR